MKVEQIGAYETANVQAAVQQPARTNEIQRSLAIDEEGAAAQASPQPSRDLVPVQLPTKIGAEEVEDPRPREEEDGGQDIFPYDVRKMSPREAVELGQELYMEGVLGYEEYSLLAFQPELHPDYDKTTGALTGEPARPDRPRDFVRQWEEKLSFQQKHNADQPHIVARTERILSVLKMIDNPTNISI